MKDEPGNRQFFITPSHRCSYLPDRQANTLFLDPRETITPAVYEGLAEQGFRRSGGHLYRPHCRECQACVPTRIPVADFRPRRRQRRVSARNADLQVVEEPAVFSEQSYQLYARYIAGRHRDGDMFPPSPDQFRSFLLSPWSSTVFLSFYAGTELVCVAVTDRQPSGLSAIYSFFDPAMPKRSLGVLAILEQIRYCREADLPHLYLGYWIGESQKMRYKSEYRPLQMFTRGRWLTVT